jgi:hypothetical protein
MAKKQVISQFIIHPSSFPPMSRADFRSAPGDCAPQKSRGAAMEWGAESQPAAGSSGLTNGLLMSACAAMMPNVPQKVCRAAYGKTQRRANK